MSAAIAKTVSLLLSAQQSAKLGGIIEDKGARRRVGDRGSGRTGESRFLGDVESGPLPIERAIKRSANRYGRLHVCWKLADGIRALSPGLGREAQVLLRPGRR